MQDMEVSWMPSYGPEMRGGTANVIVIVSSERISSPIIKSFDTAIILNQQSLDKFESSVKPGGVLIYDGNGITRHPERKDINIYRVEAAEEASRMNSPKIFNTIVLGGFLKVKPIIKLENVIKGLKKSLPERYHNLIPMNEKALKRGEEIIKEVQKAG
jgi:2-oxoglutarate ferredoxin oxidoreductase subunit gamma